MVNLEEKMGKIMEVLKKQHEEMNMVKERISKYSDAYIEGLKEGIAWSEKHK